MSIKRILAVVGILLTLAVFFWFVISLSSPQSVSVGVIGGADGPTSILIATRSNWLEILLLSCTAFLLVFFIQRNKKKNK